MSRRLFVYGSLKRGFVHHERLARAEWLREASTAPGHGLIVQGVYPALVVVRGATSIVHGELYRVGDALLAELDEFEDVPRLYVRRAVVLDDGSAAESYFAARAADHPVIADGVWRRR